MRERTSASQGPTAVSGHMISLASAACLSSVPALSNTDRFLTVRRRYQWSEPARLTSRNDIAFPSRLIEYRFQKNRYILPFFA